MNSLESLKQLQEQQQELHNRKPRGSASAIQRHHQLHELKQKIAYLEEGDTLSKAELQKEIQTIQTLQLQANELLSQIAERKRNLLNNTFGPAAHQLLN